jgi:hypothetical protein
MQAAFDPTSTEIPSLEIAPLDQQPIGQQRDRGEITVVRKAKKTSIATYRGEERLIISTLYEVYHSGDSPNTVVGPSNLRGKRANKAVTRFEWRRRWMSKLLRLELDVVRPTRLAPLSKSPDASSSSSEESESSSDDEPITAETIAAKRDIREQRCLFDTLRNLNRNNRKAQGTHRTRHKAPIDSSDSEY